MTRRRRRVFRRRRRRRRTLGEATRRAPPQTPFHRYDSHTAWYPSLRPLPPPSPLPPPPPPLRPPPPPPPAPGIRCCCRRPAAAAAGEKDGGVSPAAGAVNSCNATIGPCKRTNPVAWPAAAAEEEAPPPDKPSGSASPLGPAADAAAGSSRKMWRPSPTAGSCGA
ncbi:hypothetical protein DFJ73DRAFT_865872 [Zopfochytrium polystomum]|nr:hypothetical protein DFJ73DRAFT_865872 [Zopfochytrium polystomum]